MKAPWCFTGASHYAKIICKSCQKGGIIEYKEIIYSVEGQVAVITLNRPEAMNALTHLTHTELHQAIDDANKDDNIRVIVITGAGRGFCSRDDVKVIFRSGAGYDDEQQRCRQEQLKWIQGGSLGGDGGVLLLLPRLVGLAKAYELILTTDIIDDEEAYRIGLVNKVVPHEELMSATLELANKIASKPPISVRLAKEGIRRCLKMPLDEFKQWHAFAFTFCQGTDDHRDGAQAFMEKIEPVFKGK